MTQDEKYTQEFQKALNHYIELGFNQDECNGFMHGFHKGAEAKQLILQSVNISELKKDLLADIKISCDGTYSDAIDDWDLVDTAEALMNKINKTIDKHYC
jgi:flagellar biosynthesis/type III secretory pathway protein FliH